MRIIRKPQIERDQRKIKSGFAAGYKKGYEDGTKALAYMRSSYEAEIARLQEEVGRLSTYRISVRDTTDNATRYYSLSTSSGTFSTTSNSTNWAHI